MKVLITLTLLASAGSALARPVALPDAGATAGLMVIAACVVAAIKGFQKR